MYAKDSIDYQAFRIKYGRPQGAWDFWYSYEYDEPYWDEELGCMIAAEWNF